ncbi:glycogen synthase [Ferruginibacter lapsinanis]|uniref:glycogen synthase n=1 Tax=Ferruginibacter lapsinanis TaxID=563172 RepID=UPI001E2B4339|nr:glycogen synthase [Ferruginibacter lapsinanis]UEG49317.1 glycogen synthase [Ferruginibacter lapsinanis]
MEIIHISAECYPVAKAGGLGDVVGALPKYQNQLGHISKVVMPMYKTKFLNAHSFDVVHKGGFHMGAAGFIDYTVIKERVNTLGFDLYLIDIYGLLDREAVYGYDDDVERFVAFQIAAVDWISRWNHRPDVVHVHDHHTALIPFMMKHCYVYQHLNTIPTVLTIHNGQYQGWIGWDKTNFIPAWDPWKAGLLEWENTVNSLACGVKCASKVTTVSHSYLQELKHMANGLEKLFEYEKGKCIGILNGIDDAVWNPSTDTYIDYRYGIEDADEGKLNNKKILCDQFNLDINKPLIIFIGRLVHEKAADLLPAVIGDSIYHLQGQMNFLILGSGETWIEGQLASMNHQLTGYYNSRIGYNEQLSHQMYAGADFLLMPSRVEPCGLNQMYSMRYGTVPIVRSTGGLKDTVIDYGDKNGYGVRFNDASVGDITHAIYRALQLYKHPKQLDKVRTTMMEIDNSWEKSAGEYIEVYKQL